jgi:hypothetical protein
MLESKKELTKAEYAEICIREPAVHAEKVKAALPDILALVGLVYNSFGHRFGSSPR